MQRQEYDNWLSQLSALWQKYYHDLDIWELEERRRQSKDETRACEEEEYWTEEGDRTGEDRRADSRRERRKRAKQERERARKQERERARDKDYRRGDEDFWSEEARERESEADRRRTRKQERRQRQREQRARKNEQRQRDENQHLRDEEQWQRERKEAADLAKEQQCQYVIRQKFLEKKERERQRIRRDEARIAAAANERLRKAAEQYAAAEELETTLKQEEQDCSGEAVYDAAQAAQARQSEAAEEKLTSTKRPHPEPSTVTERPTKIQKTVEEHQDDTLGLAHIHAHIKHTEALAALGGPGHEAQLHGSYIELGWTRAKAQGKCDFCCRKIQFEMFVCPEGGARACLPCRMKNSYWGSC
jgi:hypothetical protein